MECERQIDLGQCCCIQSAYRVFHPVHPHGLYLIRLNLRYAIQAVLFSRLHVNPEKRTLHERTCHHAERDAFRKPYRLSVLYDYNRTRFSIVSRQRKNVDVTSFHSSSSA